MINLKFLNYAVEIAEGNEFRLLYLIANTMSLRNEGRTKIYRDMLADKLGLSKRQISRLTDSLEEKGLLRKDLIYENGKSVCFYSLNLDNNVSITSQKEDKNVPLNKSYKKIIKDTKATKDIKDINIEKELEEAESANTEILW